MTQDTDSYEGAIDREQVEAAYLLLEQYHGDALERPWSDDASAFYHALEVVEMALNEDFREDLEETLPEEDLQRSRDAREAGYLEATLLGVDDREKDTLDRDSWIGQWIGRVFG